MNRKRALRLLAAVGACMLGKWTTRPQSPVINEQTQVKDGIPEYNTLGLTLRPEMKFIITFGTERKEITAKELFEAL